jgi:hypothetical protein
LFTKGMRLVNFPFVMVRLRCDVCKRAGSYRLARLAAKYGAEVDLDDLLDRMTQDCPWRDDRKPLWKSACGIKFTDLPPTRPPDLPPRPLRVVQGGKR